MKAMLVILVILLAVVLIALFGPSRPRSRPDAASGQPATAVQPGSPPGMAPAAAAAQPRPAGPGGGLSPTAAATGVTTETVNLGGQATVFEAKRRMTEKLDKIAPSGRNR